MRVLHADAFVMTSKSLSACILVYISTESHLFTNDERTFYWKNTETYHQQKRKVYNETKLVFTEYTNIVGILDHCMILYVLSVALSLEINCLKKQQCWLQSNTTYSTVYLNLVKLWYR